MLAGLDTALARDFANARHQAGIDGRQLQADEDRWLETVRNRCTTGDCLRQAYQDRDAAIRAQSERAAGPAAFDETRPFVADTAAWSKARALVGKRCAGPGDVPGFAPMPGALPVVLRDGIIRTAALGAWRFAFLVAPPAEATSACLIEDVAALPADAHAAILQCAMPGYDLTGLGVRLAGHKDVAGFWTIDQGKLKRQPVGVLGGDIRCQQPEAGE
jgi:hypothetical protein